MTEAVSNRSRLDEALEAFLTPMGPVRPTPLRALTGGAVPPRLDTAVGEVAIVRRGEGPPVLLVHGWQGRSSDLLPIAEALGRAGRAVALIDLPAHGDSAGLRTDLAASAVALRDVIRRIGAQAVVAHSVGAAATAEAMRLGARPARVVLIGAPAAYRDYVERAMRAAGLDAGERRAFEAALAARGIDVDALQVPLAAAGLEAPALFVHSDDDRVVPIGDARRSSAAWRGSRLEVVTGLGHRRLLADPGVVATAVAHVGPAGGEPR
ncbi:MAG TPA: alpha/beta fold hydrolase [Burkholderiaceae bacterium]|nr:alpha/beta fold hydrolase [Burkholderiaceae bacterium]